MKKDLKQIEKDIEFWKDITEKYPLCQGYKDTLDACIRQRVFIVNKIGKKK